MTMNSQTISIDKTPELPKTLNPKLINALTKLCFRQNDKDFLNLDVVFIVGTSISLNELKISLQSILNNFIPKTILITGGIMEPQNKATEPKSDAEIIYNTIANIIPQQTKVILENKSQHILEHVVLGLPLLTNTFEKLCFITKSLYAGRTYLTLRKQLPNATILQQSYDLFDPTVSQFLREDTWHQNPEFVSRIWGEFLRIKRYGEKGDIEYQEVQALVNEILELSV